MYVTKLWSILHLQHNLPHAMKGDALIIYDFLLLNFTNFVMKVIDGNLGNGPYWTFLLKWFNCMITIMGEICQVVK
jgi:hypothetical protein